MKLAKELFFLQALSAITLGIENHMKFHCKDFYIGKELCGFGD